MKKIGLYLFLFTLASATILTSCKDDEEDKPPTVVISGSTVSAYAAVDDSVTATIVMTGESNLNNLTVFKKIGGAAETEFANESLSGTGANFDFKYKVENQVSGTVIAFRFVVTDKKDKVEEQTLSFTISDRLLLRPDTLLNPTFPRVYNILGTQLGAFDLITGAPKAVNDPEAEKDIIDQSTVSGGSVDFPSSWANTNGTKYLKSNSYDDLNGFKEELIAAYSAGSPTGEVSSFAVGDLILARVRGGDQYVSIKIRQVEVTPSDNEDFIEFQYLAE